ncbi:peptidase inhibitor family I36 protein [Isoptericola haloaureus]|uniref:peptidase inhibitor family I36 protein n=1 Tax=Isoptericola haloaureus TaxID=1542902 RepID=UPI002FCE4E72
MKGRQVKGLQVGKRGTFLVALVGSIVCALGIGMVATPAQAAPGPCPTGYACVYNGEDYQILSSKWVLFEYGISDFGQFGMNNQSRSAYNNGTKCWAVFYNGTGYSGASFTLTLNNRGIPDLSLLRLGTGTWNNKISSGRFTYCP